MSIQQIEFSEPTNMAQLSGAEVHFAPPVAKTLVYTWEGDSVLIARVVDPLEDLDPRRAEALPPVADWGSLASVGLPDPPPLLLHPPILPLESQRS